MGESIKLLIADDSEDDALLVIRHLKQSGLDITTQRVDTIDSLHAALKTSRWDAILCDVNMPNLNPLRALDAVRSAGIDVPFIVVSGSVPEERMAELMKAGVHDVIVKGKLSRLVPAVKREIEEAAVRRERKQIEDQLQAAIESVSEGFVLYDSDDRLVICNDAYRGMNHQMSDLIVPGMTFENLVRGGAERGQYAEAKGRIEEFVRDRVARHQACDGPFEQQLGDGHWMLVDERRTRDGGTVVIRTDITALKTAERTLQENEAFLRLIADNLPILIGYIGADDQYKFVNRTGAQWYARPVEEILGRTIEDVLGPRKFEVFRQHVDLVQSGAAQTFDLTVAYPDGVTRDVHAVYVPDRGSDGEIRGFVAMVADITDRVSMEQNLREREQFIRAVADNVADAVIAINEAGAIETFNRAAQQTFGYAEKEAIGHNVSMLIPGQYKQKHADSLARYVNTGRSSILGVGPNELSGIRKDGSAFPLEVAVEEAKIGGRRIFIGALRDITFRKKAESALRTSEEQFRSAFQAAVHGIALVGLDGKWLKVNRAVAEMLGYEVHELLGMDIQSVTHPDDLAADLDFSSQLLVGKIPSYHLEMRYIRKDGQVLSAMLSKSLVRDADGVPMHFVSQILDLTERKAIEAQFLQAQKMEAVGQLTGGVAHDFNNLLTVILGNAALLEQRLANGDAALAKNAGAIISAARRGAELTRRLLAFSRKSNLDPKVIEARELVSGMLDMMRRVLGETVEIETCFADESLNLLVDPNLLETALLNFATNARDAMPEGGTLTITLERVGFEKDDHELVPQVAPGQYVMVSVSDTGGGIPAEHRDHIFEPFFTTKEVGKGTGLGLSMVFGFVKQSGGHIDVSSEEGRGTTFRLYLPRAEAADVREEQVDGRDAHAPSGRETILVVEDESAVREIAVSILEGLGYQVIQAKDGPDALARLQEAPGVNLLFTDMIMPGGMTGRELAEQAKGRHPGLKVLYTSGYTDDALVSADKGVRLVRKPYDNTVLANEIKLALAS